ncbi:MAG: hypothetical protein JXP34_24940 [Planctomycetes bacterium]|nr:hypothetical protein [Planctomycetota bacterium]
MDAAGRGVKRGPVSGADWPVRLRGEWQLFVDDGVVAARERLRRRVRQPRKHDANPLLVPDKPWEGSALLANGAILRHPTTNELWMYYVSWGEDLRRQGRMDIARAPKLLATSVDGLAWQKPALPLSHRGWSETNVVLAEDGEGERAGFFHDPRDPDPARRWKAAQFVTSPTGEAGVGAYFSREGLRWTRYPRRVMPGWAGETPAQGPLPGVRDGTIATWDPRLQRYVAWAQVFSRDDGVRCAWAMAESEDFIDWSLPREIIRPDEHDGEGHEFHGLSAWPHESLWLGLLRVFHAREGTSSFQLISSRDGRHWERVADRAPFLAWGDAGSYDAGYLTEFASPPIPVPAGSVRGQRHEELWFYYGATRRPRTHRPFEGGISLARLRKDGFVALEAGEDEGWVLTRPFEVEGGRLSVNVDASQGELRAEICDADGKPIEGFRREQCVPLWEDGVDLGIAWSDAVSLDPLRGRLVRLKVILRNADLYAFAAR